jgi:hypothetical protein
MGLCLITAGVAGCGLRHHVLNRIASRVIGATNGEEFSSIQQAYDQSTIEGQHLPAIDYSSLVNSVMDEQPSLRTAASDR